jgi:hypothetical protein
MEIKRCGSRPSVKRPAENFTGSVRIDSLFDPPDPARTFGAMVTVRAGCAHGVAYPSARAGANNHFWIRLDTMLGRTQEIRPGDVVWCPPGNKPDQGGR